MKDFWLCFVPLFVDMDALGVWPAFITFTQGIEPLKVRRVTYRSVGTAMLVALGFLAPGTAVLELLGTTVADSMVAGVSCCSPLPWAICSRATASSEKWILTARGWSRRACRGSPARQS